MDRLSNRELLELVVEESAEVTKIVIKMFRFGSKANAFNTTDRRFDLSHEIGDLLGVVDELTKRGVLVAEEIETARRQKIHKAEIAKMIGDRARSEDPWGLASS